MKNLLRCVGALTAALMMCFALTVPALAAETLVSGTFSDIYLFYDKEDVGWRNLKATYKSSYSNGLSNSPVYNTGSSPTGRSWSLGYFDLTDLVVDSYGSYGFYLSYYMQSTAAASQNRAPLSSDFSVYIIPQSTSQGYSTPVSSISLFSPNGSQNSLSDGVTVVSRFSNSVSDPIVNVLLVNGDYSSFSPSWYMSFVDSSYLGSSKMQLYVNSARLVLSDSDATLDGLESITDSITAQNQILSAYYGDIVEICNQIYQRLGDMQATQEEANALLSSLVSLLDTTNGKISALNQAMSTYFELVLKSLENESLSIQDCINDAELRLETYLKPIVDYFTELEETTGESASSLPQHKTDLNKWSSDSTGIDDDAQTGLAAILPFLSAFSFVFQILGIVIGLGIFRVIIKKGAS